MLESIHPRFMARVMHEIVLSSPRLEQRRAGANDLLLLRLNRSRRYYFMQRFVGNAEHMVGSIQAGENHRCPRVLPERRGWKVGILSDETR